MAGQFILFISREILKVLQPRMTKDRESLKMDTLLFVILFLTFEFEGESMEVNEAAIVRIE